MIEHERVRGSFEEREGALGSERETIRQREGDFTC